MNPRTFLRTFVEVENAAFRVGASCLEARAAVATWLMAQEYGWPSAQETLTDSQWFRLLDILERAGLTVPCDFTGPSGNPAAVSAEFLGAYARQGVAKSLLALPGCTFRVRQYIGPLLTCRMHGTVKGVEFDGSRWQVTVALRGRADQRVPLGIFVSCTEPFQPYPVESVTSGPARAVHGRAAAPSGVHAPPAGGQAEGP